MTQIFLIIRGNRHIAEAEAKRRNIALVIDSESEVWNQTNCFTPISEKAKVIDWYAKGAGTTEPASPGDCLWYVEKD